LRVDHISIELEAAHNVLERLDKSKSDFIAIAAHELKTPLTLIEGYSAMLTEQLQQDPQHADTMLAGIGNGTRRLREIIDDMIDVSLIDNNLLSLNFQPVWLNRLLVMIQQEIQETISTRQILFSLTPFPGWDQMFFGDSERLYQALRNIISNAVKFTPDGGRISVEGRELPGFLEVRVSDTGIGIAPENQSQIFEKFGRLGNPSLHSSGKTKFKGGGPGLGLPIARGIVEAHGGTIWVESAGYDEIQFPGATFHILLPLRQEPPDKKIARLFSVPSSASAAEHKHIE
jgi:signal transduction histidine kinase